MLRRVALVLVIACGSAEAPEPTIDRSPGDAPADLVTVLRLVGGEQTLRDLHEELTVGSHRAAILPTNVGEFAERGLALPPSIAARVTRDTTVVIAAMGDSRDPELVVAFHVRDAAALVTHEGGPRGVALLEGAQPIAIDGDVVVIASSAERLESSFAWVAYGALAEERSAGVHLDVERSAAGPVRTELDAMVRTRQAEGLASIAQERAEREEPPPLGDPEALVSWLAERVRGWSALIPDLAGAHGRLWADGAGLHLNVVLDAIAGSPLAAFTAEDAAARVPLSALPVGTALASWRAHASSASWSDLFLAVGGARVDSGEAIGAAWGSTDEPILAIGATEDGPWALMGGVGEAPREAMDATLQTSFAQKLLGAALGCNRANTRFEQGRAPLCGAASLSLQEHEGHAYVIGELPAIGWLNPSRGSLKHDPDAARVLPENASGALFFDPTHLPRASRISALSPVMPPRATGSAPMTFAWTSTPGQVVVDVHVSHGGMAHLAFLGAAVP